MKRILMISELFYPTNRIGAIRPSKICKFLIEKGYYVDVITAYPSDGIYNSEHCKVYPINKALSNNNAPAKSVQLVKSNGKFMNYLRYLKRNFSSYCSSRKYAKKAIALFENGTLNAENYDACFTTYGPVSSVLIGLELKCKYHIKNWICDFRDPMITKMRSVFLFPIYNNLQNKACKYADKIIAVSDGYLKRICNGRYAEKSYMIPNGYDPSDIPDMPSAKTDGILHFVYAGALYEGRRKITPLFRALRELADEGKIDIEKICFDYAGSDFLFLNEQAKSCNMSEILKNHGVLARAECLDLQNSAGFLVLCTWNNRGEEGVFPGKFLEYMLFNKPIIALVDGNLANSEVARVMREGEFGIACETAGGEKDYAELKSYIQKQYQLFSAEKAIEFAPEKEVLNRYNYDYIMRQIEELIYE